jgi:hypothetical protein
VVISTVDVERGKDIRPIGSDVELGQIIAQENAKITPALYETILLL